MENAADVDGLTQRLKDGDPAALSALFDLYRERLRRMIELRIDGRLNGRVDCSDVLQETYIGALKRIGHFKKKPDMPAHVWLRLIAGQTLIDVHRQHLGARMRNAGHDVRLDHAVMPQASSVVLARCLAAQIDSPSQAAMRNELYSQVEQALNNMDPLDREVLALRHFEELSNDEVAALLDLRKSAASNRYVRALRRLKEELAHLQSSSGA